MPSVPRGWDCSQALQRKTPERASPRPCPNPVPLTHATAWSFTAAFPAAPRPVLTRRAADGLSTAHLLLKDAFDAGVTIADMRQIQRAQMAVGDEIVRLLEQGMVGSPAAYPPQTEGIIAARHDIREIGERIRSITTVLDKAARIANALSQVPRILPKLA